MKKYQTLKKRIKKHEGFRFSPYLDQLGNPTIGFGHLIRNNEKDLFKKKQNKKNLNNIFNLDFNKSVNDYNKYFKKYNFSKNIEYFLIEMIFQLGIEKQRKFKKMTNHLIKKNYYMACMEIKNSLWYKQTPRRVDSLIKNILKQ